MKDHQFVQPTVELLSTFRMLAIRKLAMEATSNWLLAPELAIGVTA